jgi:fluoroquinolone transport system permease protein
MVIASQALILLLLLGTFADNKVMGMAISKGFGILLLGPLLDFILPAPYHWFGAYSPLFWAGRALLSESSGLFWIYVGISIIFHGTLLWILFRKFLSRSD